jgi:hypothetical protein
MLLNTYTANISCLFALGVVLLLLWEPGTLLGQQEPWPGGLYLPTQQSEAGYGQQLNTQQSYPGSGQAFSQRGYGQTRTRLQPLDASQLEQLVAPIALYPDTLVAQVLAASTQPGQVADAAHWGQTQGYASPDQVAAGANAQNWDPSVKALTAFPQVLAQMERNLQWTSDLGNAYFNQPQDLFEALQVMRQRAQAAGTLRSTPQEVVQNEQGYIQLMPANPQVVYVPTYNPWTIYGEQVAPYPGFSLLGAVQSFLGSSPISYGLGIAMSAFSHTPWGWLAWGINWLAQSVLFHQSTYYSQSATVSDWGLRHGLHAYSAREVSTRHSYGRASDGYGRLGSGYSVSRVQGFGRPSDRYAGSWRGDSSRSLQATRGGYYRTSQQAYNYMKAQESRQQFDHRGYGSRLNRETGEGYRGSAIATYGRSIYAYHAPNSGFQRGENEGRSSGVFARRDFGHSVEETPHSRGFHLFGNRNAPKSVSSRSSGGFHLGGGGHGPKRSFGGGKHFGGGRSHGGGGHGGGKHHI